MRQVLDQVPEYSNSFDCIRYVACFEDTRVCGVRGDDDGSSVLAVAVSTDQCDGVLLPEARGSSCCNRSNHSLVSSLCGCKL